ncbi:MAG: sigma-70 family RNA polymerase sigma factor, partial [Planctomycetes bacterium]|nr:sigma-70 family RNA polymerase sigma factor [Planctomycetota bacterium]
MDERTSKQEPDDALVERAARGDAPSFDELVERHKDGVYRTAARILRDRDEAFDAVQEVFLRVYRALPRLSDRSRFGPWLRKIAVRTTLSFLEKKGRHVSQSLESAPEAASNERPDHAASDRELGEAIRAALGKLPADQRTAVILCDIEGLSYEEIADVCAIPKGTVMSRIHYGRKKLRDMLRSFQGEGNSPLFRTTGFGVRG